MDHFNGYITEFQHLPILCNVCIKGRRGSGAVHNGTAAGFGQIYMSGDKVSMKVRFQDILDPCSIFFRLFQIRCDLSQRIDDGGFTIAFDVIGTLCETTCVNLFYFHDANFLSWSHKIAPMIKGHQ